MQEFGIASGLRVPTVRDLVQDLDGTLWVAADRGLYRWNGNGVDRVEVLKHLPDLGTAAILQDRGGAIWYSGSKLIRVAQDSVKEYVLPSQNGSMRIKALGMAADGSVWIGTVAGLFHQMPSGKFAKVQDVHGTVRTFGQLPTGEM